MSIKIPDVTLVAMDTVCHDVTRMALDDSVKGLEWGQVLFFTNKKEVVPDYATWIPIHIANHWEANWFMYHGIQSHVLTSHFLIIQWDGFVINPRYWRHEFLKYDYIGAPCDDRTVGTGGFSLRSVRMMKEIAHNPDKYRFKTFEDHCICNEHGQALRRAGFNFADLATATNFAFEGPILTPGRVFGFHGVQWLPWVLTEERLDERIAAFSPYVLDPQKGILHRMEMGRKFIKAEGKKCGCMSQE